MPRPKNVPSTADMLKAARLFYDEGLSKKEIAGEMHIEDDRTVTWLLAQAKTHNIVTIEIHDPQETELFSRLRIRYPHLQKLMLAPGPRINTITQCDDLFRRFGLLAADYFEEVYRERPNNKALHVGVTGGQRILEFAMSLPVERRDNVYLHAVALVGHGRLARTATHIDPNVAASILWTHCGSVPGRCEYETVEPYRGSKPGPKARAAVSAHLDRLSRIQSTSDVIRDMDNLDVVFAGFGFSSRPEVSEEMKDRVTMESLLASVVSPESLVEEGVVGDLGYCPFDADGNGHAQRWTFFLTAGHGSEHSGIDFYKQMVATGRKVVGFGGPHLLPGIRAALKGKIVNVLIIDEHTAQELATDD